MSIFGLLHYSKFELFFLFLYFLIQYLHRVYSIDYRVVRRDLETAMREVPLLRARHSTRLELLSDDIHARTI